MWTKKNIVKKNIFLNVINDHNKGPCFSALQAKSCYFKKDIIKNYNSEIKEALIFNKNLLLENFIIPNRLKFPFFRNILEKYYT